MAKFTELKTIYNTIKIEFDSDGYIIMREPTVNQKLDLQSHLYDIDGFSDIVGEQEELKELSDKVNDKDKENKDLLKDKKSRDKLTKYLKITNVIEKVQLSWLSDNLNNLIVEHNYYSDDNKLVDNVSLANTLINNKYLAVIENKYFPFFNSLSETEKK